MVERAGVVRTVAKAACLSVVLAACGDRGSGNGGAGAPLDSIPALLNDSLPFRYPVGFYIQLIEDSVTLRLHIGADGQPVPDSTRIEVHARNAAFDTSAIEGSGLLRFRPAWRGGQPVPYTVLFPINFRIPAVPATPPDTSTTTG
ncbi:MAG: energy transducer TonB [Gemmatimonadota bacterium]